MYHRVQDEVESGWTATLRCLSAPNSPPGLSSGLTRCLFWTPIIMMMAVSPVEMTPSAESQPLSGSSPHTLVSAAVLHFQPCPGQDEVTSTALDTCGKGRPHNSCIHSVRECPQLSVL